jgi:cytochrome c peroxidase
MIVRGPQFRPMPSLRRCLATFVVLIPFVAGPGAAKAQDPPRPPSLKTVAVPQPANLGDFVRDREAALVLGKALFWDMQVGSDGIQACATCHFHAGADSRSRNQASPGLRRVHNDGSPDPDLVFNEATRPNRRLGPRVFPLSPLSNDVVSSQGVFRATFLGLSGGPEEILLPEPDPDGFHVGEVDVRRVADRNAPSVINAVFHFRNTWDGRAQNVFNGVNSLGDRDPSARVLRRTGAGGVAAVAVRLEDSSLASQAVAPPLNTDEMSAAGRTFADIGKKLARGRPDSAGRRSGLRPLARQLVDPTDGVLGALSRFPEPGLATPTYARLVRRAFRPVWWRSGLLLRASGDGGFEVLPPCDPSLAGDCAAKADEYTLLQANFALFFGLAVQVYEATLVADDSPYDRFMDGDAEAIPDAAIAGVDLFRSQTRGRCINCHEGAELTGASVRRVRESPTRIREKQALDRGFNNIGVLDTLEDPGVGGRDSLGLPLSSVRLLDSPPAEPIAVDGAFKVPGLRGVALTAPYYHNGGFATLRQVLEFYSRGGDVAPLRSTDGSLEIAPLAVLLNTPEELDALEAFLVSLTDERVVMRRAPFDHPQLFVPDGQIGNDVVVKVDAGGRARDRFIEIPAVGRAGGDPLPNFLE